MSPELRAELERWLADATSAEPSDAVQRYGLCRWVFGCHTAHISCEFNALLREEFGPTDYPFGGAGHYFADKDALAMHKNPQRLAWVRKMLGGEQ